MTKEPIFIKPNLYALQVRFDGCHGVPGCWYELASIKTPADLVEAISRVKSEPLGCRIVCKRMGIQVIYPVFD